MTQDIPEFTICYRRGDGWVETIHAKNLASVGGHLAHIAEDHDYIWVRRTDGGAIVLVYDKNAELARP